MQAYIGKVIGGIGAKSLKGGLSPFIPPWPPQYFIVMQAATLHRVLHFQLWLNPT
jgi:hypothetical protein